MMVYVGTPEPDADNASALTWEQAMAEFESAMPGEVARAPQTIIVIYQYHGGRWLASSPSIRGFEARGESLAETRLAVRADLGDYLDPAVALDERVWHPWQVTTQVAGPILVLGTPVTVGVRDHGLLVTTTENLEFQTISVTPVTGTATTASTGPNILPAEVSLTMFAQLPQTASISRPQTEADDRTTVVMEAVPSTLGQAA